MPLDLYLQVVGLSCHVSGLQEHVDKKTVVTLLPAEVKTGLFYKRNYVRRLNLMVEILMKIRLIKRLDVSPFSSTPLLSSRVVTCPLTLSPCLLITFLSFDSHWLNQRKLLLQSLSSRKLEVRTHFLLF
jgi:hypothetical protein